MATSFEEIRAAISDRINNPNALNYPDPWWGKEIEILTRDPDTTICFIQQECTDVELFWMSEIFDDLVQKTKNVELLKCLRKRAETVQDKEKKEEIFKDIEEASALLEA